MSIAEENAATANRGERMRSPLSVEADGWYKGIRLSAVYQVIGTAEGLIVCLGHGGAGREVTVNVPKPCTGDLEADVDNFLAARDREAARFLC